MTAKKSKKTQNVPKHVGRQMRKWRQVAELTQQEVADAIGCSKGHISGAESGTGNFSLPLFLAFCEAIDAPVSKVLEERLLAKHKDVDRLAAALVDTIGAAEIRWLAELGKAEAKAAIHGAHDTVDLGRLRSKNPGSKRSTGS